MKTPTHLCRLVAIFVFFLMLGALTTKAQSPPSWNPPRTAGGQPDIQGYWNGTAGIGAAFDLEVGEPPEEGALQARKSLELPHVIVDPPDGKLPYQKWALAIRDENRKNSLHPTVLEQIDSLSRCLQMGVPRQTFLGGFQIFQSPSEIVMIQGNASRTVSMDGRPHVAANIKLWAGDSVGRWEGNVLVVDVTNINEHGWYDWAGNFHSDELHLVERWTFVDIDTIDYLVTSYDPKVFTKPWTLKNEFKRNKKKDPEIFEDACYEGEKDVEIMLHHDEASAPPK